MAEEPQIVPGEDEPHVSDDANGHVHFPVTQVVTHESDIQILNKSDSCMAIHLGFLQYKHEYEVTLCIKDTLGEDIESDPCGNLHVKLLRYEPTEDGEGHKIVVHFDAHRDKLLQETVTIFDAKDKSKKVDLVFHARVLGKGQGTPALRNGIHCVRVNRDDDSDHSDWQGFKD